MRALVGTFAANLLKDRMSVFHTDRPRGKFPIVVVLILIVIVAMAGSAY